MMRDPGRPRRNPFFEHDSDGDADDPGMGWRDSMDEAATGGFAALMALAEGLAEAQPDAAEHLVAAAHEVVLTVKVLVDTTEAVLADQRAGLAARNQARNQAGNQDHDGDGTQVRDPDDERTRTDAAAVTDLSEFRPAGES